LKRDEALAIIQELYQSCIAMNEIYLCIIPPKAETPIVTYGYQVHIKMSAAVNEEVEKCITEIAKRHQLSFAEVKEEEKMVIYRKH
jgi:hypothetical protein